MIPQVLRILQLTAIVLGAAGPVAIESVVADSTTAVVARTLIAPVEFQIEVPPYSALQYLVFSRGGVEVTAHAVNGDAIQGQLTSEMGLVLDTAAGSSDVVFLSSMRTGTQRLEISNPFSGRSVIVDIRVLDLAAPSRN